MSSCRCVMLALVTLTALGASPSVRASSPDAWVAHKAEVVAKCKQASGLKNPRLVGQLIEYDDSAGITAALIAGVYPQPHMRQQPGRSLCLFDRRSRTAQAAPADSLEQP